MKTAGKVKTTTFKSGHLLKRGGKSGCERDDPSFPNHSQRLSLRA
jgi:hypothetical protein